MSIFALRSGLLLACSLVAFGSFADFSDSDSENLSYIESDVNDIKSDVYNIRQTIDSQWAFLQNIEGYSGNLWNSIDYFVSDGFPDFVSELNEYQTYIKSHIHQILGTLDPTHYDTVLQSIDSKISTTSLGIRVDTGLDVVLTNFQDSVINFLQNQAPYQPAFLTNLVATLLPVDIWKGNLGHLLGDYYRLIFDGSPSTVELNEFKDAFMNYGHRIGTIQDFSLHLNCDLIPRNSAYYTTYDTYLQVPYRTFLREYSGLTTAETARELQAVKDLGRLYNSQFGTKVLTDTVIGISNALAESSASFIDYNRVVQKTTTDEGTSYNLSQPVVNTVTGIASSFSTSASLGEGLVDADTNAVSSIRNGGYASALNALSLDLDTLSDSISILNADDLSASLESLSSSAPNTFSIKVGSVPLLGQNTIASQLAFPVMRDPRITLFLNLLFGLLKVLLFYTFGSQIIEIVSTNLFAPGD